MDGQSPPSTPTTNQNQKVKILIITWTDSISHSMSLLHWVYVLLHAVVVVVVWFIELEGRLSVNGEF
jgi:hypothetical protein